MANTHRVGGKFSGSHTTCLDLTCGTVDAIHPLSVVKRIVLGFIENAAGSRAGEHRVKIADVNAGFQLTVRQGCSTQQVYLHVNGENPVAARLAISRALRNNGIPIKFHKPAPSKVSA